ncbi:MAG: sulfite exporter TauE/SafE family protein, partial [Thiotrichales bacterium]
FGLEPSIMKPAALTMNIFVTTLVLSQSRRSFQFDLPLFIPIIVASVPMAFLGGAYTMHSSAYKIVVGLLLLFAVCRMFWRISDTVIRDNPKLWQTMLVGGVLGFVSGVTGVGGGIFLSPLLLLFRWTDVKGSVPIAAAFILLNSVSGLLGYVTTGSQFPAGLPLLVIVAVTGALIGTHISTCHLSTQGLYRMLGLVLVVAGFKMIMTAWA